MLMCHKCGLHKPADSFSAGNPRKHSGRSYWCRDCMAAHNARPDQVARRKATRERRVSELNVLKDVPCVDCGGRFHPAVMEFDHVRGMKRYPIQAQHMTRKDLREELAKCELRCANCHRLRHALERA